MITYPVLTASPSPVMINSGRSPAAVSATSTVIAVSDQEVMVASLIPSDTVPALEPNLEPEMVRLASVMIQVQLEKV